MGQAPRAQRLSQDASGEARSQSQFCYARFAAGDEAAALSAVRVERWLSAGEQLRLESFRSSDRRRAWLKGRVLAKQLLLDCGAAAGIEPAEIEIGMPVDNRGRAMRPVVIVGGAVQPWCLSISHTEEAVLAAISLDPRLAVGVDLACEGKYSGGFLSTWFTDREQRQVSDAEPGQIAACWAVKEAVYKACQRGESFTPRRIEVLFDEENGSATSRAEQTEMRWLGRREKCWQRIGQKVACVYHGHALDDALRVDVRIPVGSTPALAIVQYRLRQGVGDRLDGRRIELLTADG